MTPAALPSSAHPLVTFRHLVRDDAPAWYAYLAEPAVVEHTSWNLRGINDLLPNFDAYEAGDAASPIRLAVVLREGGQLVGPIGLNAVSPQHRTADIAYDLSPAIWNRGVASAIVDSVVAWAMRDLGFMRIQATVLDSNLRSLRVLQRCAFEREGYLRSYRLVRGKPRNFWLYARIAEVA